MHVKPEATKTALHVQLKMIRLGDCSYFLAGISFLAEIFSGIVL